MANDAPLVLLTGAAGAIGRATAAALAPAFTPAGIDRHCKAASFHCVEADITSAESLSAAVGKIRSVHGPRIASVIHLAAYFDFTGERNPLYEEVNVGGTERLLEALQSLEVEQFVYASTILVHRPTVPGRPIDESWPLEPKWAYPESKVAAEEVVRRAHGSIPCVILRIAGMYDDECHSPTLANQIQRIYERSVLGHVFPGNRSHGQSFIHIDDLTQALRRTVEVRRQLPAELTLLVGEPGVMSFEALQLELGRLIHGEEDWETAVVPKTVAKTGAWAQDALEKIVPDVIDKGEAPFIKPFMVDLADDHIEIDISRARRYLDWEPQRTLRGTLPAMVGALKRDPLGFYRKNKLTPPAWLENAASLTEPASPGELGLHPAKGEAPPEALRREHEAAERQVHRSTLWAHFANFALGTWLIASPAALGYGGDRFLAASDMTSGALLCILAALSLIRDLNWPRWAAGAVGLWLLFAPLAAQTPPAAAYLNDTLAGVLAISLALLVPRGQETGLAGTLRGPDIPPGWSYCPSLWSQRLMIIGLALFGFYIARYLAAYQMGHIPAAWDPFFGSGTERIVTSHVSEAWPVPDAGLGAMAYLLEAITGAMGDRRRWRTMPWMVIAFGILVVPLGGVSIFFIIIQPIWLGTWCTLCLVAAAAMVVMIPYAVDEVLATVEFLRQRHKAGRAFWRTFFLGDTIEGGRSLERDEFDQPPRIFVRSVFTGGVSLPWNLAVCIAIGVFLMFTRVLLGTEDPMADSDHLVGALVITVSATATAEIARVVRFVNIPFGVWLLFAPWVLSGASGFAAVLSMVLGLVLIAASLPRGKVRDAYGYWNKIIV